MSSEASWVESEENGTARRIEVSAQRCHQYQAEELLRLHRLAPHVKWTHQKLYNIGNDLGQTKVCDAGVGGIHPLSSLKSEQCLPGGNQGPDPLLTPVTLSDGSVVRLKLMARLQTKAGGDGN